jgi:hypothetical protein
MAKSYFGIEKHDPDDADQSVQKDADDAAAKIAQHAPIDVLDTLDEDGNPVEPEQAAEPAEPVAATPEPEPVPTPEPEQPEAEPYKLAGSYATIEELEKAHEHLRAAFGRQGQELGELRKAGRAATPPPAPVAAPPVAIGTPTAGKFGNDPVWSDPRVQQAISHKAQAYVDVGYGTADAKRLAEADVYANTLSSRAVTETVTAPLTQRDFQVQRNARLQADAAALKDETDPEGRPLRSDWNEITETPEFESVVHEMGDHIYDVGPDNRPVGLETAYLRSRFAISHRIQTQASAAVTETTKEAERVKVAAGAIPASPGAHVPADPAAAADEQEILDIYDAAKGLKKGPDGAATPYFLGGGYEE